MRLYSITISTTTTYDAVQLNSQYEQKMIYWIFFIFLVVSPLPIFFLLWTVFLLLQSFSEWENICCGKSKKKIFNHFFFFSVRDLEVKTKLKKWASTMVLGAVRLWRPKKSCLFDPQSPLSQSIDPPSPLTFGRHNWMTPKTILSFFFSFSKSLENFKYFLNFSLKF